MKYCPMTFHIPDKEACDHANDCVKDKCAWWDESCQKCAIAILADSARKQVKK